VNGRLLALVLVSLLAPACVRNARNEVDPKWEMAIRKGMPFVSATPIESPQEMFSMEPNSLLAMFDAFFVRAFLRAGADEHLVLETTGPQHWLQARVIENDWRALHLVLMPDRDLVLRCYPRVGDMPYYDSDFFTDSPTMSGKTWYHVKIFLRLFRQLSEKPLRDLRLDFGGGEKRTVHIAAFYVEREP
jgi:hypothetical protein